MKKIQFVINEERKKNTKLLIEERTNIKRFIEDRRNIRIRFIEKNNKENAIDN